jgi:chorismate mutase
VAVRAVRGATRVDVDERDHVLLRSRELMRAFLGANDLSGEEVVSILFSVTPDIRSVAPALAARQLGLHDTALLCVQEMAVDGSMPGVVRFMAHVDPAKPEASLRNVYLHGTEVLRQDVPPVPEGESGEWSIRDQ